MRCQSRSTIDEGTLMSADPNDGAAHEHGGDQAQRGAVRAGIARDDHEK